MQTSGNASTPLPFFMIRTTVLLFEAVIVALSLKEVHLTSVVLPVQHRRPKRRPERIPVRHRNTR